jgi:hypothetical protein
MSNTNHITPTTRARMDSHHPHPRVDWLLARLRAPWLDRQLAAGTESWRSPVYAARARQLTDDRTRRTLARSLERLVEEAETRRPPFRTAVVQPCRPQVREARPLILTIAQRLRSNGPVGVCGIARLQALLSNGTGPCYTPSHPDALITELRAVADLLEAHH